MKKQFFLPVIFIWLCLWYQCSAFADEVQKKTKPWQGELTLGADYNTNASGESRSFKAITDESGWSFPNSLGLRYDVFKEGPWAGQLAYVNSNAFYAGLEQLNLITHTTTFNLSHKQKVAGRPVTIVLSPTFSHATVDRKYYSGSYVQPISVITSLADWHRMVLTNTFSWPDYKLKGAVPAATSREGSYYSLSWVNNFYPDPGNKRRYWQAGYDFGVDETEGSNFARDSQGFRLGVFFPFCWDSDFQVRYKYRKSDFSESLDVIKREDNFHSLGFTLNIPVREDWVLTPHYIYTNNLSSNGVFRYANHTAGATMTYSF